MNIKYAMPFIIAISPITLQAQKIVILTNTPQKVPIGKIWKLQTNKKTLIEVSYSTLKSGNKCNADILSNPSFIGTIYVGEYGNPIHGYGMFIKDLAKTRYTNNVTYSVVPVSIIDENFSISQLQNSKVEDVGYKELVFYPGDKVYTFECLGSIQLLELPFVTNTKENTTNNRFSPPIEKNNGENMKQVFVNCEQSPEFIGGQTLLNKYIKENIHYPELTKKKNIEGKVIVRFVVNSDSTVSNVEILKGIGSGCDEEAIRLIENMPKWIPGRQNGHEVNSYYQLPIVFSSN